MIRHCPRRNGARRVSVGLRRQRMRDSGAAPSSSNSPHAPRTAASRKIPIAACGVNDQRVHGRKGGPEIKIDERQMHVGAVIPFFRRRLARGIPEGLLVLPLNSVLEGVERVQTRSRHRNREKRWSPSQWNRPRWHFVFGYRETPGTRCLCGSDG